MSQIQPHPVLLARPVGLGSTVYSLESVTRSSTAADFADQKSNVSERVYG
jgi:hypothetical protein